MANLIENSEIFYTPFEPQVQNRFILQMEGIPSFMMKKVTLPGQDCSEVVLDHINIQRKLKGKCKWQDVNMTLYNPIQPSGAQAVMEWIRTSHESVTGRDGYADFYKRNFDIFILGPVGDKVSNWKVVGGYVKTANFGELDWGAEAAVEIQLTIAYDYAVLEY